MDTQSQSTRKKITRETMFPLAVVLALLGGAGFVINTNAVAVQNRRDVLEIKGRWEYAIARGMLQSPEQKREVVEINRRLIEEKFQGIEKELKAICERLSAIEASLREAR